MASTYPKHLLTPLFEGVLLVEIQDEAQKLLFENSFGFGVIYAYDQTEPCNFGVAFVLEGFDDSVGDYPILQWLILGHVVHILQPISVVGCKKSGPLSFLLLVKLNKQIFIIFQLKHWRFVI